MTEKIGGNRNGVILKHEQEKVTVRADTVGSVRVCHHSLVFIDEIGSDDDEFVVIFFSCYMFLLLDLFRFTFD